MNTKDPDEASLLDVDDRGYFIDEELQFIMDNFEYHPEFFEEVNIVKV